jgi:hypothetical protein
MCYCLSYTTWCKEIIRYSNEMKLYYHESWYYLVKIKIWTYLAPLTAYATSGRPCRCVWLRSLHILLMTLTEIIRRWPFPAKIQSQNLHKTKPPMGLLFGIFGNPNCSKFNQTVLMVVSSRCIGRCFYPRLFLEFAHSPCNSSVHIKSMPTQIAHIAQNNSFKFLAYL